MTRRILTTFIAHSRQRKGFAILQAMGVVVVTAALLTAMTTLLLLELDSQQQSVTRQQQQDISDSAVGWITSSLGQADLPLKATGDDTVTYTVGASTNPPGTCYQISLDQVSHVLSIKGASYSGSGDCSLELGSTTAQTLASTIVNDSGRPIFTYYSTTDSTQPIADASNATTAKSVDVNLQVQGKNTNNLPLATLYHLVFGGSVTTPKIVDTAVTSAKLANNAVACASALTGSPQQCDSSDASHTTSSVADSSIDTSASDSFAFESFNRAATFSGSAVNYGPPTAGQVGQWRTNQSSPSGSGLSAGSGSSSDLLSVNWNDLCIPGKALYARGVYTLWNPSDSSGAISVGARMMELAGPTVPTGPSLANATSTFAVAPGISTPDGGYSLLESSWQQIDSGSCSASSDLMNSDPYWYVLETKQGTPAASPYPYGLVNAAIEVRYTPAATVTGAQAPNAPILVSPADDTFDSAAKPTLKARFSDPNQADTGQLSFQICADSVCNTVDYSGNSNAGIANGADGTWQVPSNLPDGTYYWRAQATDSTALVGPWSSTNIIKIDSTAPTVSVDDPIGAVTSPSAQYYNSATKTLWYSNSTASTGSFSVSVHGNGDPTTPSVWGIDTITFPSLGAGWTGGGTVQSPATDSSGNTSPDPAQTYTWSASSGSASPATVTLTSVDGQSATATFNVSLDATAPTGATISYPNGTATGTITISGTTGSDSGVGVADGGKVQEATEAYSSGCPNSWGGWTNLPGMPFASGSSYSTTFTVTDGTCYKFRYISTDRVGNQETVTSANVVQGGSPPLNTAAPTISDNQSNNPPLEGDTLSATPGTWTGDAPISYTYQWQDCGYKNVVMQDSPVGYWRLGESSGTFASDTSGNSNAGIYSGAPTFGATGALSGDPDKSLTLNGSSQYVEMPNAASLNFGTGNFSLEAWVKTTASTNQIIIDKYDSSAINGYQLTMNPSGQIGLWMGGSGFGGTGAAVNNGSWHYVVASVTRGSNAIVYVDGSVDETFSVSSKSSTNITDAVPLDLGRQRATTNDYFAGALDDVAVYAKALTSAQVTAHYNAGHSATGLCSDISGATSATYSPNNAAGTTLLVKVTATNAVGSTTASSAQTGWVTGSAPNNTSAPTVSDNSGNNPPQQGDLMAANPGSWVGTGNSYAYQWQRCNTLPAQILSDSPALYYRFDEAANATYAFDSSGHARDGIYANTPTTGATAGPAGAIGSSVSFSGIDSYVQAPNPGASGAFTLETWVNFTGDGSKGATGYDSIMGNPPLTSVPSLGRLLWNVSTHQLLAQFDGASISLTSTGTVGTGSWHLIDFVYDGSNITWYIDGTASGTTTASGLSWNHSFKLGAYDADNYMLNGSLDEAAVYPSALSAARISAHYSAGATACSNIAGATSQTYTAAVADARATLRINVTATNSIGTAAANSSQTVAVGAAAPAAVAAPTTSGSTGIGQALSTTNGSFNGTTPLSYTYQWQRIGYAGVIEDDTPFAFLRLDETGGNVAQDDMFNDSGLYVGSPTLDQGPATLDGDRSVAFNGSSQYVDLNNSVQFDSGNFTVEGWFQTVTGAVQQIWNSGYNGGNSDLELLVESNGQVSFYARDASGAIANAISPGTYTDGQWHYVAATRNGSTFTLYIDGAQVAQATGSLGDVDAAGATSRIGNGVGAISNRYFSGRLDDIAVYKSALTATKVTTHYTAGTSIGVNISGDTSVNHVVTAADGDNNLRAVVTATNGSGSTQAGGSPENVPPPPVNLVLPSTTGLAQVGQTISAGHGIWRGTGLTYTYQWQDCNLSGLSCTNIAGATGSSYAPSASDVGSTLVVQVTATSSSGSGNASASSNYAVSGESYRQAVQDDQPLYYWRLGEASGTTADDEENTLNGTYYNSPTLGQPSPLLGTTNTAATFNGTNQYVSAGSSPAPYLKQFTLEGWVKIPAIPSPSNATIVASLGNNGQYDMGLQTGTGYPFILFRDGTNWDTVTGPTNIADGSWHYVVGTFDGTTEKLYVDGTLVNSGTFSGLVPSVMQCPFQIGGVNCPQTGYSAQYLNGSIDDVAVYDHAISASQVTRHWRAHDTAVVEQTPQNAILPTISGDAQAGQTFTATAGSWSGTATITNAYQWQRCGYQQSVMADNPLQYLRLDEGNGTVAYDQTAHAANGTYTGFSSSMLGKAGALSGDPDTSADFAGAQTVAVNPGGPSTSGNAATVEFWMYWNGTEGTMPFSWGNGGYQLGDLYFSGGYFGFNSYNSDIYGVSDAALANSWHLIDAVFPNGAPSSAQLYIDGIKQTLAQKVGTTNLIGTGTGSGYIAADDAGNSYYFQGDIDDFAVYSGTLSSARVAAHYESGITSGGLCSDISGKTASTYATTATDVGNTVRATVAGTNSDGTNYVHTSRSNWITGTYASQIKKDGPIVWYRENETTGTSATDSSGNAYTGTYGGSTTLAQTGAITGDSSTSAKYETNASLTGTATALPTGAGNYMTVEFWMKSDGSGAQPIIFNNGVYSIWWNGVGQIGINTGDGDDYATSAAGLVGSWHLVDVVLKSDADPAGNDLMYIDGEPVTLNSINGNARNAGVFNTNFVFANLAAGNTTYNFGGLLDEPAIYPYMLNASQILNHFNAGTGPNSVVSNPTISGTAQDEQLLTTTTGTFNGVQPRTYSYKWEDCDTSGANCVAISGATSATYTVKSSDVGHTIRSQVTMNNSSGSITATSTQTATVIAAPPTNTVLPALSGVPRNTSTLSTTNGTWTGTPTISYSYQWQRCTSYQSTVLADNPIAYWKLNETSGTSAADSSGAANTGTYSNVTLGAGGALGCAQQNTSAAFNGTSSSVTMAGNTGNFTLSTPFSVEAWFYTGTPNTEETIAGNAYASAGWNLRLSPSGDTGHLRFLLATDGSNADYVDSTVAVNANQWYHVLATFNTGTALKIYLNGADVTGTVQTIGTLSTISTSNPVYIGRDNNAAPHYFNGDIAQVALYTSALSAAQASAHYSAGSDTFANIVGATASSYTLGATDIGKLVRAAVTGSNTAGSTVAYSTPSDPVQPQYNTAVTAYSPGGYWRLDELSGTNAADSSGNGNAGTYQLSPTLGTVGALNGDTDTAVTFNGTTQYVSVPDAASLRGPTSFTVEAWEKTTSSTGIHLMVSKWYTTTNSNNYWFGSNSGNMNLAVNNNANVVSTPLGSLDDGNWHFLVGVADASAGLLKLYADGNLASTAAYSGSSQTGTSQLWIGASSDAGNQDWAGGLDEVAFYPSALSAAQVKRQYLAAKP